MSKHRVLVLKVIAHQLTVTQAPDQYGMSRRKLHRLLARYRQAGIDVVNTLGTGEILSEQHTDATRGYWRNQLKPADRWPKKRPMSRDT
ncbi:MAG: hypothetical protein IT190_04160 [Microbacteriaceae bacterium]|nr:hypothetical protein [Microbacteriaceae bacterium]